MVDTDRITGAAKELGGKIQGVVGDLTGSHRDTAEGRFREAQGAAENAYGQAKDSVRHAADQAQDYAGHAADQARDLAGHASDRAGDLADRARDRARDFAGDAQDYAEDAQGYAHDVYERGSRSLRHGARQVGHQVAEYPLASLVIAGLVGFGVGLLVSANRD